MQRIKETIVVEGRDDKSAVLAAVDANIICTHGYGISKAVLEEIKTAHERCGIIIFTDPDHAGRSIREKLLSVCPGAKQAFLTSSQAFKRGDIGIENASAEDIIRALKAAAAECGGADRYSMADMDRLGLAGAAGSAEKRAALGAKLGIGSGNAASFLKKLNFMNIDPEKLTDSEL